jgi:hypothetical protein
MIKSNLEKFLNAYKIDKSNSSKATKSLESSKLITQQLPNEIYQEANLLSKYLIKGSLGKGIISDVPWICVFDQDLTKSDITGYYLVYAFAYKREAEEFHARKDAYEERGVKQDFHFKMKNNGYLLSKNMDFGEGAKSFVISISFENSKIKNAKV